MESTRRTRDKLLNLRTTSEAKDALRELAVLMGEEIGAKLTQAQAFEILVTDALRARRARDDD